LPRWRLRSPDSPTSHAQDLLPSWNDTAPKKAIVAFVEKVTKEGSPDFVPLRRTHRDL
jgi:hypothetical protein